MKQDPIVGLAGDVSALDPMTVCDGNLQVLVERYRAIQQMAAHAKALMEQLTMTLGEAMPADTVDLPGYGYLVREHRVRKVWRDGVQRADMLDAAKGAIARQVATDPATGEVIAPLRQVALRTFDLVEQTFSLGSDPKMAFRRVLGLDPTEWRAEQPAGVKVEFQPLEGE